MIHLHAVALPVLITRHVVITITVLIVRRRIARRDEALLRELHIPALTHSSSACQILRAWILHH